MLKRATYFVFYFLVFVHALGCASYRQGAFPNTDPQLEMNEQEVEIRVGAEVQVETIGGVRATGEVIRVSESELVIGRASNYGFEERTFNRAQVARIEVRKESGVASLAVSTLGILTITLVSLAVLVGATGGIQFGD